MIIIIIIIIIILTIYNNNSNYNSNNKNFIFLQNGSADAIATTGINLCAVKLNKCYEYIP